MQLVQNSREHNQSMKTVTQHKERRSKQCLADEAVFIGNRQSCHRISRCCIHFLTYLPVLKYPDGQISTHFALKREMQNPA